MRQKSETVRQKSETVMQEKWLPAVRLTVFRMTLKRKYYDVTNVAMNLYLNDMFVVAKFYATLNNRGTVIYDPT